MPSGHPYVEAILPDEVRLPDPTPPGQTPGDGVWWPPVVVDADWITRHASEIDLVHLHFGFESFSTEHLSAWLGALDAAGLPLVQTVHDLENPHLQDQEPHRRALDLLVPRAAAVLTLTDTAADVVAQSWGCRRRSCRTRRWCRRRGSPGLMLSGRSESPAGIDRESGCTSGRFAPAQTRHHGSRRSRPPAQTWTARSSCASTTRC
ncbi:hypothetical protein GCM10025862_31060 [Arsenicicoccus piscis]|uniref:Glycosyltransferase subfamily 4-like N-terminal domain-containing protein n=1 Tax=Arsenicicoccus piscis TaxID=673954 RepID=A0ABQ6HRK7_9MICO|nr:hypothetical protein GCM10025862_31060 [Arsenicicoccus piscis]